MSLINSMKIAHKLVLAFVCLIAVSLLCSGMIYWQRSALETSIVETNHTRKVLEGMDLILATLVNQQTSIRAYIIVGEDKRLNLFRQSKTDYAEELAQLKAQAARRSGAAEAPLCHR